MPFKLIFIMLNLFSTLAIAEEANLFQVNYSTQSNNNLHSLQKKPDTKIYAGMNKEKDNIRMLEDGYDLMGGLCDALWLDTGAGPLRGRVWCGTGRWWWRES